MFVYELGPAAAQMVVDIIAVEPGTIQLHLLGPQGQYVEDLAVPPNGFGHCVRQYAATWQAGTVFFRYAASLPLTLFEIAAWMASGTRSTLQAAE